MPKHLSEININLVPQDPFFQTYLGKTLKWALSVGRYIVIFTELIVILSFVTRFSLDRQITDLNDSIHQKQTVIESFGNLEESIRDTQMIIDNYLQIEQQTNIADVFPILTQIIPHNVALDQLIIKPDGLSLTGTTASQQGLSTFLSNIQLVPNFSDVEVAKIATDQQQQGSFEFVIQAKINK